MIGTLTLAAAMSLAPMQPGQLNLINARTTYGELGPPRTDNNYLPSDLYFLSFDIDGIKTSPEGIGTIDLIWFTCREANASVIASLSNGTRA